MQIAVSLTYQIKKIRLLQNKDKYFKNLLITWIWMSLEQKVH
jgi:hypothetical protein